jgi:hypothetical protein
MADITPPTIAITANKSALKYGETALITFTLSEIATDFVLSDITVSGGTLSNFSGSGTTYSATFTPLENSTVAGLVSVGNYKFADASGNANEDGNEADNRLALSIDTGIPTITISSSKSIFGVGETALVSFKLSEPSIDFTLSDVIVSGGVLTNFGGTGANYTATFTPNAGVSTSGSITVGSNAFSDTSGNLNNQSSAYGVYLNTNSDPQVPKLNWTKLLGGSSSDSARAISTGPDGSIYVGGFTYTSLDGQTTAGGGDAFITKFNADGTKAWTRLLGTSGYDSAYSLTTGPDGSIFVGGGTSGSLDGQANSGGDDAFVTKYKPDGTKVWTRLIGSAVPSESANGMTTGLDGSVYIGGTAYGSIDGQNYVGLGDAFVTKFSPDGTKLWTRLFGAGSTESYESVKSLTTGLDGFIYACGFTNGSLDGQSNNGYFDAFVTKYNPDGTKVWTRLIGASSYDTANALTVGTDGAIYVGGYTNGGVFEGIQNNSTAGFISKFLPDGTRVWTKLNLNTQINALKIGQDGAIFAGGNYLGGVSVDGQVAPGGNDAFVARYEIDGTKSWTRILGSTSSDNLYGLTVGTDGSLFLAGDTYSDLYGEKSLGTPVIYSGNGSSSSSTPDAFLLNFSVPDNVSPKISISVAGTSPIGLLKGGDSVVLNFAITEAVKDFVATDITVQGGTLTNFQGTDKNYTATFTASFDGSAKSASVGNGKFSDSSGNFNLDGADADNRVSFTPSTNVAPVANAGASQSVLIGTVALDGTASSDANGDVLLFRWTLTSPPGSTASLSFNNLQKPTFTADVPGIYEASLVVNDGRLDSNVSTVAVTATTGNAPPVANAGSNQSILLGAVTLDGSASSDANGDTLTFKWTLLKQPTGSISTLASATSAKSTFTTDVAGVYVFSLIVNDGKVDSSVVNTVVTANLSPTPDTAPPTIRVFADTGGLITGQTKKVTFVLSEPSNNFVASDVKVTGGTLSDWVSYGDNYTAVFTPTANSTVSGVVSVASGVFTDAAQNANADGSDANNSATFSIDTVVPTISLSTSKSKLLAGDTATLTFTLSEASTTFTASDVVVSGGTISNFAGSGSTYTAIFTPTANSTANGAVSLSSGVFTDTAGNSNTDGSDTNNSVTMTVNTVLADTIFGGSLDDLINGSAGDNLIFGLAGNDTLDGAVGNDTIDGGEGNDYLIGGRGNDKLYGQDGNDIFILGPGNDVADGGTGVDTVLYFKKFDAGEFLNGIYFPDWTITKLNSGEWTVSFTYAGPIPAVVGYREDFFDGTDTLTNIEILQFTDIRFALDLDVSLSASKTKLFKGETSTLTFTLSEASTTFTASDITVTGGTLSNFVGSGTTYIATFTPAANSTANGVISVATGVFTNAIGNANADGSEANNSVTFSVDTVVPTISLSSNKTNLITGDSATLTFTLSEASTAFTASDVTVAGGSISNFAGSDTTYTATFTPTANSTANGVVSVASGVFIDVAGNANADGSDANNAVSIVVDTVAPTVSVSANKTSLIAGDTTTITFTLSEASTTFTAADVLASGGVLSSFAGSGTNYTALFTPTANSTASGVVSVASGVFTDTAGNANANGSDTNNAISLLVDTAAPTIALSTSKSSLIAGESATLTFVLSEASTTFLVTDVSITGGTLSNFTGSGVAYAATFTPAANSTANGIVSVTNGVFTDSAGNANTDGSEANNTLALAVDTVVPTIALSTIKTNLIEGDTATVTFTLSESSSTFIASDITMTGGTVSNFSGSGTTYTATFTPTPNSTANGVVSVASGVFTDTAGNINADGADKNNALNFIRVPAVANETHTLSVIVDKNVLGVSAALLKDLKESITFTNGVITKHTVEYESLTFDYSQIDALITTVTRDGEFTAEFTKEINDYLSSELNITYAAAVKLLGAASIDSVILTVAGADGNFVG